MSCSKISLLFATISIALAIGCGRGESTERRADETAARSGQSPDSTATAEDLVTNPAKNDIGETAMGADQAWNDETRESLRATLRAAILGELRLAKRDPVRILDLYREVYIEEDCPENEWEEFTQFAAYELERLRARIESEQATWPDDTDCDRLDRVEAALRGRGIVLWQASPCCDTCSRADLRDRIDVLDNLYPGFRDQLRGYAFFIDQNLPEMLSESTELSVYLAYGCYLSDGSDVTEEEYEKQALDIAREVIKCLRDEGFEIDWNGDFSRKIGISINWQRRTLLE